MGVVCIPDVIGNKSRFAVFNQKIKAPNSCEVIHDTCFVYSAMEKLIQLNPASLDLLGMG